MIASLVSHLDAERTLTIHLLGIDLPRTAWEKLEASTAGERIRWNYVSAASSTLTARGFSTSAYEHVSVASLFRLLLPELLPVEIEKVLYLDCDLIVRADISALWRTDIADVPLAAVGEWNPRAHKASSPAGIRRYRELGISPNQRLFNAGVLLVNLAYWRRSLLAPRAFDYIRHVGPEVRWHEQEALNVVCDGRYRKLEPGWNVPADIAMRSPSDRASIVHYLTAEKPWHWYFDSSRAASFFDALDQTAWAGWRPERPRFGGIKRIASRLAKARAKRLHAIEPMQRRMHRQLEYWRSAPTRRGSTPESPAPRNEPGEIRLFIAAREFDADLARTLEAYLAAGAQRVLVLLDSSAREKVPIPSRYTALVHVFVRRTGAVGLGLRHLLHRYGQRHWCVLGAVGEIVVDETGSPVSFRNLCTELDETNTETMDAASEDGEPIELVRHDARSNRVFRGTARVTRSTHAYEPVALVSRVILLKYDPRVRLDADARLIGNARKSARCLRLKPLSPPNTA